ncbi:glycosyl transferase, partial [Streptomyces sp. SID11233]|nr:glycosyl transferase [Streptomyces sp. SID11233]
MTPTGDDPARTTQLRVEQTRTGTFRGLRGKLPRYDYEHHSRLAGPLTEPDPSRPYRVRYRSLLGQETHRVRAALLLCAAPVL